ncbi:MAG: M15 family metallopeptidase [Holdemanella sp.]|nr:M15 family metallopeptidase [Holdemanella sp.]
MAKKKIKRTSQLERILIVILAFTLSISLILFLVRVVLGMFVGSDTTESSTDEKTEEKISIFKDSKKKKLTEEQQNRVDAYRKENPDLSEEDAINQVLMNLDLEPYSITNIIEDDSDMTLLVNKYNAMPEGYIPDDLVDINYVCEIGVDYSCTTMDRVQLRKEAAKAYEEFCEAAAKEGLNIVAIAAYRSYEYQAGLWSYYADLNGQEYADEYYARPGQSEHNTGLAVDISFNGYNFNEIENYEGYDWILENMPKYGFILRYPENKVDIHRYGYESWHFRYVGKEAAKKCVENNWTLEEYTINK